MNVRGTLEAAHEAISAFFLLSTIFGDEAKVWWVFNHRAFLEAMCMANILRDHANDEAGEGPRFYVDTLFITAKADIVRMIELMHSMSQGEDGSEVAKTRASVLSNYL